MINLTDKQIKKIKSNLKKIGFSEYKINEVIEKCKNGEYSK